MISKTTQYVLALLIFAPLLAFAQPINDECATPIPFIASPMGACTYFPFSTVGATQSSSNSCAGPSNDDIWFSFVATTPQMVIRYRNAVITGASTGLGFAVYDACGNAATFCNASFGSSIPVSGVAFFNGGSGGLNGVAPLVAGETYFVQIFFEGNTSEGAGDLCFEEWEVNAPLPVELTSFNAYATNTHNRVEWSAASELDFYMYTVERAIDPASFHSIAEIAPKGTDYSEAVYSSEDLSPSTTTYYRLRMEDLDGTVEYSNVVSVNRDDVKGDISMFPNPAKEYLTFEVLLENSDTDIANVVLTDLSGRVIRQWNLNTGSRTDVSLSNIPSGIYTVSTYTAMGVESQRLVIE